MDSKRKIINIFLIILILLISPIKTIAVYGEELTEKKYNSILFLIDCSNSMNYQDEEKLTNEIIKMFIDGCYSEETEIGFVSYSDKVLSSYPLTSIKKIEDRNDIKTQIDKLKRQGSTDIGMALRYGMEMLKEAYKENTRPAIILFSDGETDLTYSKTGRTYEDSKKDEELAFEIAKDINCPIYTIGLSRNGNLNTDYLQKISEETGGKLYKIQNSSELLELFNTLFEDVTKVPVITNGIIEGSGAEQKITLSIPNKYISETNILIQHNKSIGKVKTEYSSSDMNLYNSKRYTGIKINDPMTDSLTLNFYAALGDTIKINVINYANVIPKIEISEKLNNAQIPIKVKLFDLEDKVPVSDNTFYDGLTAELIIQDLQNNTIEVLPMENTGTNFLAIYNNKNPKTYALQVNVRGEDYNEKSTIQEVVFKNNNPEQSKQQKINVLKQNKEITFDLNDYFSDIDEDLLTYTIINHDENLAKAEIKDNMLILTPIKSGLDSVKLQVSDNRGGIIEANIQLDIMPFWIYYKKPILGVLGIFSILLIIYLIFLKKSRSVEFKLSKALPIRKGIGFHRVKFEGYFLKTLSGNKIPVLNWNAAYIEDIHFISLGDLFSMLDVNENLREAYKIYFEAGRNGTVIFYHETDCIITFKNQTVPRGKKEILHYDDRLHIIFEDNVTEMELRFKHVKNVARV
ncbi:vWA domain-containing protein [Defluviitalea phaphyphila]|uniref:vWA domain-containing protein n=1 Tax=Defluviitalea phaphyphila TaxID=1473580 RepID=UPI0007316A50|nr:vWA domain-containing protein [Defluviitalea phaphyphila]